VLVDTGWTFASSPGFMAEQPVRRIESTTADVKRIDRIAFNPMRKDYEKERKSGNARNGSEALEI
jgi:hypothetical protein